MGTLHTPLASPFTLLSALRAEIDENGVRHVLMCRMILGNTETIPPASKQLQPSSTDFDSGIDNPLEPTKYIFYFTRLGKKKLELCKQTDFTKHAVLSGLLPPTKMRFISNYYNEFQANKIDRPQFIRRLRSSVGDNVLFSVIKLCNDQIFFFNVQRN
ncbi:hypothetical protein ACS0TY_028535 [Phlomoides rotata]